MEKHNTTLHKEVRRAHGKPESKPTWSSGAKTIVGTAVSAHSRIWYTVANGTLNEMQKYLFEKDAGSQCDPRCFSASRPL